ncbi:MAG: hypothetical protein Salg2KO_10430 [Salibacteraceae bacterium]
MALSQEGEEDLRKSAEEYFEAENYDKAFAQYSQLLALKLQSPEYNFRFGACQLFTSNDKEQALKYLKFAVESENNPNLAHFYYGLGLHLNYQFEKAIKQYEKYRENASKKDSESELVDHYISQCKSGIDLVSSFTDISVINRETLPRTDFYRNYDLSEFGGKIMVKPEDFMSEEDKKRDSKFLMYFQQQADYIYYASHSDKNETGKDLYVIQKLPTGEWSKPKRLSDVINTPHDEDYPFIHPDGNVLYFASKGHNSMGGYDVFKSTRRGDGTWTKPINMEFAINTPWDDFLFISDKDEKMAWFASNRETNSTQVSVYRIGIQRVPLDLTLIKGTFEADGSRKAKITVEDVVQNKVIGVFSSERQFGEYLLDLRGSGQYKFIIEAEESNAIHTGLVEIPREKGLKQFRQEMKLVDNGGKEQLQIINHFDEPLTGDESLLTAEILRKQASLDINSTEDDIKSTTILDETAENDSANEQPERSIEEKIADAEAIQEQLQNDADVLTEKAAQLYNKALTGSNSSDPLEIAEAALAAELAGDYIAEAEQRKTAAQRVADGITSAKSSDDENAINATINQIEATNDNFMPLQPFEAKLESSYAQRAEPIEKIYENKNNEVEELQDDLKSIDEEIAYYTSEIENTKDETIKEELSLQKSNAQAARPEKQAAIERAEKELEAANSSRMNAEIYNGLAVDLMASTAGAAKNVAAGTVTASTTAGSINQLQAQLSEKAASNAALVAFIAPDLAAEAAEQALAESRKERDSRSDESSNSPSSTSEIAANESNNTSTGSNNATNSGQDQTTNELTENETETSTAENSAGLENTTNVNDEIRIIQGVESQPEIIPGDYTSKFEELIADAETTSDPIIAETRKAEIYDQWSDNIQYRIDSLETEKAAASEPETQAQLAEDISVLMVEKEKAETLAMTSYTAIAELSDAEASTNETLDPSQESSLTQQPSQESSENSIADADQNTLGDTGQNDTSAPSEGIKSNGSQDDLSSVDSTPNADSNDQPTGTDELTDPSTLESGTPEKIEAINALYAAQLNSVSEASDSEKIKKEIQINKAWTNALQNELIEIGTLISAAETNAEKYTLEDLAAEVSTMKQQRDAQATELQLRVNQERQQQEALASAQSLQSDLNTLVESYNSSAFIQLEAQIEKTPDSTERSAQQELLYKNWLMGLKNEEYKTETRIANSTDPNQIADLQEKLIDINAEKVYVARNLDRLSSESTASVDSPSAPKAVVIKGSERFEGYESVGSEKPFEYDERAQETYATISEKESKIATLETELEQAKKKDKEVIQAQIENVKDELAVLEVKSKFYEQSRPKLEVVEQTLLQKEPTEFLASEKQIQEAEVINMEAQELEVLAEERRARAAITKRKKEKPAMEKEAREAARLALMKRTEADLASTLATEMALIEERAIAENFIIPAGEAAPLPIVTRTLNPTEKADVAQTDQFVEYNVEMRKADSIQRMAGQLALLERTYTEQAQQLLEGGLTPDGSTPTSSIKRTQEAFVLYEKADSASAAAAKLNRQAAVIENKANIALLQNPEEVYTPILAYYNDEPTYTDQIDTGAIAMVENDSATAAEVISDESLEDLNEQQTSDNELTDDDSSGAVAETTESPIVEAAEVPIEDNSAEEIAALDEAQEEQNEQFDLTPPEENEQPLAVQEDILTNTIFEVEPNSNRSFYTETTPIPVNPELPSGILFKVQIGAFRNAIQQDAFKGIKPITGESAGNGLTRYTAGAFSKFAEADFAKDEIRGIGYSDAFVVAYRDGKRISVEAAQEAIAGGAEVAYTRPQGRNDRPQTPSNTGAQPSTNQTPTTTAPPRSSGLVKQGALEVESVRNHSGVFYTVQVGVFSKPVGPNDLFGITPLNQENMDNGNYRYSTGVYRDRAVAERAKEEIVNIGVTDAFVTAYKKGVRITLEEAEAEMNAGNAPTAQDQTPPVAEPTESTTPTESTEYRVLLGTFAGQVPVSQAAVILSLGSEGIEKIENSDGTSSYYLGSYVDEAAAQSRASQLVSQGLSQAKAVAK